MSMPSKLRGASRGRSRSPTTAFKKLWPSLKEGERRRWINLFGSDTVQREMREIVASELGVRFKLDKQLTNIRHWIDGREAQRHDSGNITLASCLEEAAEFPEVHEAFVRAFGMLAIAKLKASGNHREGRVFSR